MKARGSIPSGGGIGLSPDVRSDAHILLDDIGGAVKRATEPLRLRIDALPLEVNTLITARHDEIKREFSARVGEVATHLTELPVPAPPPTPEAIATACRRVIREECGAPLSAHLTLLTVMDERTKAMFQRQWDTNQLISRLHIDIAGLTQALLLLRQDSALAEQRYWLNRLRRMLRSLWKREDS